MSNASWFQSPIKSSSLSLDLQGVPEKSTLGNQNGQPGPYHEDPAGSNVCQLKTRMWGEVGASQVPQPTCWWKRVTPCQAGTLSRWVHWSSWLIPLRRSTRPPPQVLWARGPCPRNTDFYTKQEKQSERKELATKNKTQATLSQQLHLSIMSTGASFFVLSVRCAAKLVLDSQHQNSCAPPRI